MKRSIFGLVVAAVLLPGCAPTGTLEVREDDHGREVRELSGMIVRRHCRKCGGAELRLVQVAGEPHARLQLTGFFDISFWKESEHKWRGRSVHIEAEDEPIAELRDTRWTSDKRHSGDVLVVTLTTRVDVDVLRRAGRADRLEIETCEPDPPDARDERCDTYLFTGAQIDRIRAFAP